MPRTPRLISSSGCYHVMLRGIDKRSIFQSDFDYMKFINYIEKVWIEGGFEIYAYCLMSNHVHLLIGYSESDLGNIIRRITVGYVQYFNYQNSRIGHMFQNRFKSEVVQDDAYFLTVMRYIHRNPIKANIVVSGQDYPWSSYKYYLDLKRTCNLDQKPQFLNTSQVLNMLGDRNDFIDYMEQKSSDQCMEFDERNRITDEQLTKFVNDLIGENRIDLLAKEQKMQICTEIQQTYQTSVRQLIRVLHFRN